MVALLMLQAVLYILGPVTVVAGQNLKAITVKPGYASSEVGVATYAKAKEQINMKIILGNKIITQTNDGYKRLE